MALSTHWFAQHPDRGAMVTLMLPVLFMAVAFGSLQTRRMPPVFAPTYSEYTEAAPTPLIADQAPHHEILPATQEVALPSNVPLMVDVATDVPAVGSEPAEVIAAGLPFVDAHLPSDSVRAEAPVMQSPVLPHDVIAGVEATVPGLDSDPGQHLAAAPELGEQPPAIAADTVDALPADPVEMAALAYPEPPAVVPNMIDIAPEQEVTAQRDSVPAVCKPVADAAPMISTDALGPMTFGARLAAAAMKQTEQVVIYTARYKRIAYPMGDLPPLHGACSDLVVRAYRALGTDLQELVQRVNLGRDPNIDHRRTQTLRRLFSRFGQSLTISQYPEDYMPGDIVTYYRPFSRVSRAHIAIVADVIAPSGRPMIIHNRGWGPQLEDALFADQITGHYRFRGIPDTAGKTGSEIPLRHSELMEPPIISPQSHAKRLLVRFP